MYHLVNYAGSLGHRTSLEASMSQVVYQFRYRDVAPLELIKIHPAHLVGALGHRIRSQQHRGRGRGGGSSSFLAHFEG